MIQIKYSEKDKNFHEVMEQITSMTLDHSTTQYDGPLLLEEGSKRVEGKSNILNYLEDLRKELHSWYYCNC